MGSAIRFTGLSSGLDTASIVTAIMTPYQTKIDTLNKNQVMAEWRKDAYKEMSTKIQNFRNNAVSKLKYASDANKSKVEVSQAGVIKFDTSNYKEDGTHKIEVTQLAKAAIVTTQQINNKITEIIDGNNVSRTLTKDDKITDIPGMSGKSEIEINGKKISFTNKESKTLTIAELEEEIAAQTDVAFKYDEKVGAFIINSATTGFDQTIDLSKTNQTVLDAMGIKKATDENGNELGYVYEGKDARIIYNDGLTITSSTNDDIEVNGIKFTALATSNSPITLTVSKDTDAMVDVITNFVKEYNTLLDEINTMLYADSAKGYEPLTDEEKEAMTEKEIEKWEEKIKGSLLRNDSTLKDLSSTLRDVMSTDYSTTTTKPLNSSCSMLAQLGIKSSSWSDRGKLTIDEDELKTAILENGDGVTKLLETIANKLDKELNNRSATTELRSYGQYFNDKIQTDKISQYKSDIITAQAKYDKLETMYYKKFTAMETAMNKLNSQSSLFSSY